MNATAAMKTEYQENVSDTLDQLITLSKLDEKIDGLSTGITGTIENDRHSMPAPVFNQYKAVVVSCFNASVLKQDIRKTLSTNNDDELYRQVVTFLKKPEIIKIIQQEHMPKTPEAMMEAKQFFASLENNPPTQTRKGLIEKLDKIKHSSSVFIDTQVELFRAITFGMRGMRDDAEKITDDQLHQLVVDMKTQATPHMERHVWTGMLYIFKNQSDNELKSYISLCETSEGRLAIDVIDAAFLSTYKQMIIRLQKNLEKTFI